jgi:gamma-glutamyltranspeptidase
MKELSELEAVKVAAFGFDVPPTAVDDLIARAVKRAKSLQNDLLFTPPEAMSAEGREFQSALPWLLRMMTMEQPSAFQRELAHLLLGGATDE